MKIDGRKVRNVTRIKVIVRGGTVEEVKSVGPYPTIVTVLDYDNLSVGGKLNSGVFYHPGEEQNEKTGKTKKTK